MNIRRSVASTDKIKPPAIAASGFLICCVGNNLLPAYYFNALNIIITGNNKINNMITLRTPPDRQQKNYNCCVLAAWRCYPLQYQTTKN